jgi:hypothetical protein
VEAEAAQQ